MLNPEIYRLAAEFNFLRSNEVPSESRYGDYSRFSCDNIWEACNNEKHGSSEYKETYATYFQPEEAEASLAWWQRNPDGTWDHESRILALLLMAEILEDEQAEA